MIKKLAQSIREYKKQSLLAPLFVICEVVLEVVIPIVMANLIDYGITAGSMNEITKYGIILALCALISLGFGFLSAHYGAVAAAGYGKNLRKDIFYSIQDFSFGNIDKFQTSSLITRLTTDVTNVQNAYMMIIRIAVRCPVMLVFALFMAFSINQSLALIFVASIPILGVGLYLIIRVAYPIFEKVFKTYDDLNQVVQENLRGIRVVKSFVREDFEKKKFGDVSKKIFDRYSKAEKLVSYNMPLMQFTVYGCMLLISWMGANLIVVGDMSVGQLMSLFSYAMQILMSLMMLSMVLVMITISKASAERIAEVLTEQPELENGKTPVMEVKKGSITFENAGFSYAKDKERLCLSNINLKIEAGQTIGILGGTGSGKSSLVQLIPRLYDATEGRVLVGGVDVRDYDMETLRESVAMVLQKNVLFSGTIKENLRWGFQNATDEELEWACRLAQADGFIREFQDGYDTYIEQGGTNISGGQKQRLCIARALLKRPKILILDDSTSAVDMKTDALLRSAFQEEIPHMTKLIIAQRISSIEDADRILVMDGGRIDAAGTHEELLKTSEIYREVYESQKKGGEEK